MSIFRARVDAAQFCKALNHVLRFAAKRPVLPILGEAKVSFEEGRCTLTCTNLKQWCMAVVPAVGDSFSFVFSGTQSIVSACKYFAGELEFTYTCIPTDTEPEPAGTLVLSAGGRSMERSTQRISDFPEFTEKPMDRHYPVDAEKLLERFKRIGYAVSPDDKRPARCCIEFVGDKILAVDGYRMAMSSDPSICVEKPFFIPPEVMAELQMFKGQDCTISVGEEWATFGNESLRLITRIPGDDGLDLEKAIPTHFDMECSASVDELWNEVKYLYGFVSKRTRSPLRFDGASLVLKTDEGTYSSSIGLPPVPVRGFNPRYLLEGLSQFKGKKVHTITLKMNSPHAPLVLTDGESDLAMVLPVRLKDAA